LDKRVRNWLIGNDEHPFLLTLRFNFSHRIYLTGKLHVLWLMTMPDFMKIIRGKHSELLFSLFIFNYFESFSNIGCIGIESPKKPYRLGSTGTILTETMTAEMSECCGYFTDRKADGNELT
jgi:hypothetical protein